MGMSRLLSFATYAVMFVLFIQDVVSRACYLTGCVKDTFCIKKGFEVKYSSDDKAEGGVMHTTQRCVDMNLKTRFQLE